MKLDIEICRQILLVVEEQGTVDGMRSFPHIEGQTDDFVYYQIKKMTEAGYVSHRTYVEEPAGRYRHFRIEISFTGHEFLRQMLNDTIWNKTKEMAKKSGMSLTFETIKAIIPMAIQKLTELM